ncbi:MAG: ABC transporter permease [Clostridia bacterium]|nr:ABC transporter permease [Clostridia bacterium]MBP5238725.1 ABC transporter permease [Clostridia bacterium]MBP5754891.1 ABC transporter permease [Clostridia bacterium]
MAKFIYILKRLGAMLLTLIVIYVMSFVLIKLLPVEKSIGQGNAARIEEARREALGYNKPIMEQLWIYTKNILTKWDWGTSWKIDYMADVGDVITSRLPPTMLINVYSLLFSVPVGILLGIFAAIKKNKWQDQLISVMIMLFISVPSYVYAFLVQYILGFKAGWFPLVTSSLYDAGNSWFSWTMFHSMVLPVLSLSFGDIAGLARFTRAELTEQLSSDYMLLARTKGLTRSQATVRHALKNAMVPILPSIISMFVGVIGGSIIIEQIFGVPGIGALFLKSINLKDYDVFMASSMFYTVIGLAANILIDLSYGFLDPRIRMGER